MSASSWWVTCGIIDPVARQVRPRDLLDARQRHALDLAELREVDLRPRRQVEPGAGAAGAAAAPAAAVACASHVLLGDPALAPAARARSRRSTPQLARQPAHRRARVDRVAAVGRRALGGALAGGGACCGRRLRRRLGADRAAHGAPARRPRSRAASSAAPSDGRLGRPGGRRRRPQPTRACPPRPCRRPSARQLGDDAARTAPGRPSSPCRTPA